MMTSNYIVTDLEWFADLIHFLSNSKTKSKKYSFISKIIGDEVPIVELLELKEFLIKQASSNENVYFLIFMKNITIN